MAQKTNLNATPYYDDFNKDNNYSRILFRPGYAVQARELTQLQSQLQFQIEAHGSHIFKNGAMVLPGRGKPAKNYVVKLENTFNSIEIDPSQYYNSDIPVILTGVNGVTAAVTGYAAATTTDQSLLYVTYTGGLSTPVAGNVGGDEFINGELLSANIDVTHSGTSYAAGANSIQAFNSSFNNQPGESYLDNAGPLGPASTSGHKYSVGAGIYYIRGNFVANTAQTVQVSNYTNKNFSKIVGWKITENIITPENQTSLLDNAQGSTNYAAKGAHRLQISLDLVVLDPDDDKVDFVELASYVNGTLAREVRHTEYSHIADTLARRTFDESGNYTVRPFQYDLTESVTINENEGRYAAGALTEDGNTASTNLLTLKVSPGKAYIEGYEMEKIAPSLIDITKARDFENFNAGVSTFNLGNFSLISNLYGTPDISLISGETTPFKTLLMYDTFNATRGSANGNLIGVARARAIEHHAGVAGANSTSPDAVYKLYMFDIRPFTILTLSGTPAPTLTATHTSGGVQLKGNTSGATGYVYVTGTAGTNVNLTNVIGTFQVGETLIASDSAIADGIIETGGSVDITITNVTAKSFSNFRSVYMDDDDSGQDFTADFVTQSGASSQYIVQEESTTRQDGVVVTEAGDLVDLESIVSAIIQKPENNVSLVKFPKGTIKTLLTDLNNQVSDTQYTVRRQFVGTSNASGVVTFNAGTNETFLSHSEKDYTTSIITEGDGSGAQGDVISVSETLTGAGTASITITDASILGSGAKIKILCTLLKTSVTQKNKTVNLMKKIKVLASDPDGAYGTRSSDKDISLGRADVFKLVAVYDSEASDADAVTPSLVVSDISGTFIRGEILRGQSSSATGRIIDISSPIGYTIGSGTFQVAETITGVTSGAIATVVSSSLGSKLVTNNFLLDTGMRDNFYDISRIIRKPRFSVPTGRMLVVYDYMEHGSGDMMTVDSYTDIAERMTYEDIPTYSATKVDPDAPAPGGQFPLYDTYDFRPRIGDIAGTSTTLEVVDQLTNSSFDFNHRVFSGTGSSMVDFPKAGSLVQADFEYYLSKKASVFIDTVGDIRVVYGSSSENPSLPSGIDKTLKLCDLSLPAYTFKPKDVGVERTRNQRFTMKDIGRLEDRITSLEYYTTLSLLEKKAQSFETTDANGLNRFKAGFVVDNFTGHRVGDTLHPDYKCSMDFQVGELRPVASSKNIGLSEVASNDAERTTNGYQKTGDLITLPYTEEKHTENPFATSVERVTPLLMSQWKGILEISPTGDEWFETEIAPEVVINVEGNYDSIANTAAGIGTVWNAWQTTWQGTIAESTSVSATGNNQGGVDVTQTRTTTTKTDLTRTGTRYEVQEKIDKESQGFKVISKTLIPFCRSRNISFVAQLLKPRHVMYMYFDKIAVSQYVTPKSLEYSGDAIIVEGSPLISNGYGMCEGVFRIPDPRISGNPKFKTGEVEIRLTSNQYNQTNPKPKTSCSNIYYAKGLLETQQETIISTRNAVMFSVGTSGATTITTSQSEVTGFSINPPPPPVIPPPPPPIIIIQQVAAPIQQQQDWDGDDDDDDDDDDGDPVAQTFMVEQVRGEKGGKFITSVELYFQQKPVGTNIAVFCEIRNVINGYPGPKVLPFARKILYPDDIALSNTASTATKFTFPSPVYVKSETEYTIIVGTSSPEYKLWRSVMGETDQNGQEVYTQPHVGVFFRGHNNRAWQMAGTEDLTFKLNVAKFDSTASGNVPMHNDALDSKILRNNPIVITDNSLVVKVRHQDHGMYATSNNVIITGVESGLSNTISATINSTTDTISLTSATNFNIGVSGNPAKYAALAGPIWYAKIDDEIISYTGVSNNTLTGVTRGVNSTTAANHSNTAIIDFYQLHKVPLYQINKTHTGIANIDIDSYTISVTSTPVVDGSGGSADIGGKVVTATENYMSDLINVNISKMELPGTSIVATMRQTAGTSPDGSQTSFVKRNTTQQQPMTLNDNYYNTVPYMVASQINETNEMSGTKSLSIDLKMSTTDEYISPVIDTDRNSAIVVSNRLTYVDEASDIYPTTDYIPMTDPEGDSNGAIYLTKKVTLDNPATSLKVIFDANRESEADIKVLYKILRTDDASDFDELGYIFFNDTATFSTSGEPDTSVPVSLTQDEFREYTYTAGITDDGIGEKLDDFISFQIKIVLMGTNSARPPRVKDLRILALAT
jgi:hypothetical protein